MFLYVLTYVGGMVPFSNPSGILVFGEESVQRINLTVINNDTLEVHMYTTIYICTYVATITNNNICMY